MLDKWLEARAAKRAAGNLLKSPIAVAGRDAIHSHWTNAPFKGEHSSEFMANIAAQLMARVVEVAAASDPVAANREHLLAMVIEAARYEVLVIAPPPAPDPVGIRGLLGITGELRARLPLIVEHDTNLQEQIHGLPNARTADALYNVCLVRYRQCHAGMHVHHMMRFPLRDYNTNPGMDWFRPFYLSQCAVSEHQYRIASGLHSELDPFVAFELSTLMNSVLDGSKWPDLAWEQHYNKKLPRLPVP